MSGSKRMCIAGRYVGTVQTVLIQMQTIKIDWRNASGTIFGLQSIWVDRSIWDHWHIHRLPWSVVFRHVMHMHQAAILHRWARDSKIQVLFGVHFAQHHAIVWQIRVLGHTEHGCRRISMNACQRGRVISNNRVRVAHVRKWGM